MNHCVPDFATEEEYSIIPTYSDLTRRKNLPMAGQDEIMELLWQNGELVIQSHNQIPLKKPRNGGDAVVTAAREIRSEEEQLTSQPFIQEDEMASWLQYPMDETSFYTDFYPDLGYPALRPLSSYKPASAGDLTVVDSNEAPAAAAPPSRASLVAGIPAQVPSAAASSAAGGFLSTMGSTSGESGASASAEPSPKSPEPKEERKRKGGEDNRNMGCQSVDVERELPDPKKHIHQSISIKRSRAAEVHNLSERRRRDRINEKMKALQDLIPHCNKTDKASMLDDAIEYLKSLQLQLQMMSIGCGMVPMMYPGVQQYMAAMGMGLGMAVEMGMNRPILPYPSTVAASALPTPAAVAHLDPRFPVPAFQMHPVPLRNQSKPMLNMHCAQIQNQPQIPNFPNPYQHYSGLQQTRVPLAQIFVRNQAVKLENSSCGVENRDDPRSG